jgi:hypothetical protein
VVAGQQKLGGNNEARFHLPLLSTARGCLSRFPRPLREQNPNTAHHHAFSFTSLS